MREHLAGVPMRAALRGQPRNGVLEMQLGFDARVMDRLELRIGQVLEAFSVDAVPLTGVGADQRRSVTEVPRDGTLRVRHAPERVEARDVSLRARAVDQH